VCPAPRQGACDRAPFWCLAPRSQRRADGRAAHGRSTAPRPRRRSATTIRSRPPPQAHYSGCLVGTRRAAARRGPSREASAELPRRLALAGVAGVDIHTYIHDNGGDTYIQDNGGAISRADVRFNVVRPTGLGNRVGPISPWHGPVCVCMCVCVCLCVWSISPRQCPFFLVRFFLFILFSRLARFFIFSYALGRGHIASCWSTPYVRLASDACMSLMYSCTMMCPTYFRHTGYGAIRKYASRNTQIRQPTCACVSMYKAVYACVRCIHVQSGIDVTSGMNATRAIDVAAWSST
jgi:hypothetical protein